MANTHRMEDIHYRADPSEPALDRGSPLASRVGVWLILALIATAVLAAGVYLFPHPRPLMIKPGVPQAFSLPNPPPAHPVL